MDFKEMYVEVLKSRGFNVLHGTQYCESRNNLEHKCHDCEGSDGCSRLCAIGIVMLEPMMYTPKTFEEFEQMMNRIKGKVDKILDPKTTDAELKQLV